MDIYFDELNDSNQEDFNYHFKFIKFLGKGSFGKVVQAIYLATKQIVAVKIIEKKDKKLNTISKLKKEIVILQQLKHKNVVELINYIETNRELFIIMEYVKQGNLKNYIEKIQESGIYNLILRDNFT